MSIPRVFTAMITPFDDKLEVDYDKAAKLANDLLKRGSDALVISGTTGEAPTLSREEKKQLFKTVKEAVGNKAQVWAGTGNNDTKVSVEMNRMAEELGMDGVLCITPYYNKPTQEGLYQHFKTLAQNTSLPIMVYNVPGRTGVNMLPETIARLAEWETIAAVKEASGNIVQMAQLVRLLPERIRVYSGDDALTLPALAVGAVGIVSVASHVAGLDIKAMIEAYLQGNTQEALRLHQKLMPVFEAMFICSNPIPVKESMNLLGYQVGDFRLPLTHAGEKEMAVLKKTLQEYGVL